MKKMLSADVGWLAGIIEGEGWFVTNQSTGPLVCVAMTDYDVVRRLQEVTGVGRLNERVPSYKGAKNQLQWLVGHRSEVEDICHLILPFMGERRSMRILEVLSFVEDLNAAAEYRRKFFACGHPATPENIYVVGRSTRSGQTRMCRTCSLQKTGERHKKQHAAARAARTDGCAQCGAPLVGRHMNAKTCSKECAYAVILEKNRQRRHEKVT
jgi:hypothetical protein